MLQTFSMILHEEEEGDDYTAGDLIPSSTLDMSKHKFFYKLNGVDRFASLPFTQASAEELFAVSSVAAFGRGAETVVDESYRLAREIKVSLIFGKGRCSS